LPGPLTQVHRAHEGVLAIWRGVDPKLLGHHGCVAQRTGEGDAECDHRRIQARPRPCRIEAIRVDSEERIALRQIGGAEPTIAVVILDVYTRCHRMNRVDVAYLTREE